DYYCQVWDSSSNYIF
nr:immunoglobulin light chain junction region [Macaca mulatta]MOX12567.1 immunoglobulin light chain junction region [Macaca mulatta]